MVQVGAAFRTVQDTTAIELEDVLISFNANWDRLVPDGNCKLIVIFRGNLDVSAWLEDNFWCIIRALLISSFVGIIWVFHYAILDDVIVCRRKIATIASFVTILTAVNNLLFTKGDEFSAFNCINTFQARHSTESPAGPTLSLVFDIVHSTFISPVNIIWNISGIKVFNLSIGCLFSVAVVECCEFKTWQISIFV
jgi:hypothetical protein